MGKGVSTVGSSINFVTIRIGAKEKANRLMIFRAFSVTGNLSKITVEKWDLYNLFL